jgi:hypothetical protein
MTFRLLTQAEMERLALAAHSTVDALCYRFSNIVSLQVLNLTQLKEILKLFKEFFPSEKIYITGNKNDLLDRVIAISSRCVPEQMMRRAPVAPRAAVPVERKIDNSMLPSGVVRLAVNRVETVPSAALRTFEGTGASEEAFRACQSPNWQIVEILGVAPVRYSFQAPHSETTTLFEWKNESKEMLTRDRANTQVHLRAMLLDGKEARFRPDHNLLVNYQLIPVAPGKPPRKNLLEPHYAPPGIDASPCFSSASNVVSVGFQNTSQWSGVLVAALVHRVSTEALAAVVPSAPKERELRYQRAPGGGGGSDLQELSFTVSLDDVLSLSRIEIPVQSLRCDHFQCFDLSSFLEFAQEHSVWNCPVCNHPAPPRSLFRLQSFQRLLDSFPNGKLVICNPDGSFVAHEPEAQGKYERKVVEKRKILKAAKRDVAADVLDADDPSFLKRSKIREEVRAPETRREDPAPLVPAPLVAAPLVPARFSPAAQAAPPAVSTGSAHDPIEL